MATRTTRAKQPQRAKERLASESSVAACLTAAASERQRRFRAIRAALLDAFGDAQESMRRGMPTFEKAGAWVALASRKHHLAVYLCDPALLDGIRARHPELECGARCVRIRDTQHLPIYELRQAFARAFAPGSSQHGRRERAALDAAGDEVK